ncbi:hypothetical protein UYSO10_0104 [Kosakonia radicincitans]|nr:hypothetical protein UYSO10_0104 [Kosakonia radicincitans]
MTEFAQVVNRKIIILSEECSAKMKKVHDAGCNALSPAGRG